jgi:hypothetical protein
LVGQQTKFCRKCWWYRDSYRVCKFCGELGFGKNFCKSCKETEEFKRYSEDCKEVKKTKEFRQKVSEGMKKTWAENRETILQKYNETILKHADAIQKRKEIRQEKTAKRKAKEKQKLARAKQKLSEAKAKIRQRRAIKRAKARRQRTNERIQRALYELSERTGKSLEQLWIEFNKKESKRVYASRKRNMEYYKAYNREWYKKMPGVKEFYNERNKLYYIRKRKKRPQLPCKVCGKLHQNAMSYCSRKCFGKDHPLSEAHRAKMRIGMRAWWRKQFQTTPKTFLDMIAKNPRWANSPKMQALVARGRAEMDISIPTILSDDVLDEFTDWSIGVNW